MDISNVKYKFGDLWADKFKNFIESEKFDKIFSFLKSESLNGKRIVPESKNIFRAFSCCSYNQLKVVVIAQDPYFSIKDGKIIADGIAFSCSITDEEQPSLKFLKEEIERTCYDGLNLTETRVDNDLSYLSEQGVLMLNSSLTTEAGKAGAHIKLWSEFMEYLIKDILNNYNSGLVFILLGSQAKELRKYINEKSHTVLTAKHPASASYSGGKWDSEEVFSQTNKILDFTNGPEYKIKW